MIAERTGIPASLAFLLGFLCAPNVAAQTTPTDDRPCSFYTKLSASAAVAGELGRNATVSDTFEWADPIIGVRWEVPVLDRVSAEFRGDVGGFGASSDLIWGLVAGVRYFDRSFDSGGGISMQFRGPYSGLGLLY